MASILLADDDASVRALAKRALEADGHSVVVASDGLEALELFSAQARHPAALITDVDMPELDGISLAKRLVAIAPDLAVVLMSGYAEQLDRAGEIGARRVNSISKPFTLDQFRQAVRSAF
jgi:CheY-like chemotaxis protein